MKALIRGLTLRHPWPAAITWLGKDVENRHWTPQSKNQAYGPGLYLAIHGGTTPIREYQADFRSDVDGILDLLTGGTRTLDPLVTAQWTPEQHAHYHAHLHQQSDQAWVMTGIVAVAQLQAVTTDSISPWAAYGQYHWELTGITRLPQPITPTPGLRQGLWTLSATTLSAVRRAYWEAQRQACPPQRGGTPRP